MTDEGFSNPCFLKIDIHREIGQVAAITEVGDRTCNTNQVVAKPGSYERIGVLEHLSHAITVIDRTPFGGCGSFEDADELIDGYLTSG
jgi:hypothetical protein